MVFDALAGLMGDTGTSMHMLAYLDAGTGSIVFQWIVAAALGGAFALKMSWRRITAYFSRGKRDAQDND